MPGAVNEFRRRLQRRAAERVVPTAHGVGLLADSVPNVYDANYLSVESTSATADVLAAEAGDLLSHVPHRRVIIEDGDARFADGFAALGYHRSTHLVMTHAREPDRRVDASLVLEVPFDRLIPARTAATLAEPWGNESLARQLNDAKRLIIAAVDVRFFGVIVDGQVAAYCELRQAGDVAQIEDVNVVPRFRGRGLGRAIVQHALDDGRRSSRVVYLEALADDWPRELYTKLGFAVAGRRDFYTRPGI